MLLWLSLSSIIAVLPLPFAKGTTLQTIGPNVTIDGANFQGISDNNITFFLGIPYAEPPINNLRFNLPAPISYTPGFYNATDFGPSCPQQAITLPFKPPTGWEKEVLEIIKDFLPNTSHPQSEDCLTINIARPQSVPMSTPLPVVVWIYGGGFETGSTSNHNGSTIVQRSMNMSQPVIYVSMNYRVSLFGFLASEEVMKAGVGNLGLQDQREALRWIQRYIKYFGGDPNRVTIWGESAGSMSVSLHLLTNGGNAEGLFRGAFMQSGSPLPVGNITHGQPYYDAVVKEVNCSAASDTLVCLRNAPFESLQAAMNNSPSMFSYQALNLAWVPRADGVFLTDTPQNLVAKGSVARVPIVSGDCDDEGTLFSLSSTNITTDNAFLTYIKGNYMPLATAAEFNSLITLYPNTISEGSPFDTGPLNALTPEYKRLAAVQGDMVFQAPRRYFLSQLDGKQNIWAFLSKRYKVIPYLGAMHGSDLLNVYGDAELTRALVAFTNTLNPNYGAFNWPQWNGQSKQLIIFDRDSLERDHVSQGTDTFRQDPINLMIQLNLKYPL